MVVKTLSTWRWTWGVWTSPQIETLAQCGNPVGARSVVKARGPEVRLGIPRECRVSRRHPELALDTFQGSWVSQIRSLGRSFHSLRLGLQAEPVTLPFLREDNKLATECLSSVVPGSLGEPPTSGPAGARPEPESGPLGLQERS